MISQVDQETFKPGRISRVDKEKRFHDIPEGLPAEETIPGPHPPSQLAVRSALSPSVP